MQVEQTLKTTPVAPVPPHDGTKPSSKSKELALPPKAYNPDVIYLSTDRRQEMQMVVTATGEPLGFKTPKQEASYLKSLEMAAPVEQYDPKGFLKSLGLWGIVGSGRGDDAFVTAVKDTDYKPHFGPKKFPIAIPGFIMKGMVNGSPSYEAVQGFVDPALSAYTNKRALWKKPLEPAQKPKPTDVTPQQRYAQPLSGTAGMVDWGSDFHDGEDQGKHGYGTFQIAVGMGFTEAQARRFSHNDSGVDTNKTPYGKTGPIVIGQMDRHFNFDRKGEDTRILWARRHLELAIEYGRKGAFDEAEVELGVGLHSLQDLFAHAQLNPTVHATLGKFVDDPQWSPVSMVEATVATRNYLKAYLKGITNADGSYELPPEPVKPSEN
jgi:hypothetical protein